MKSIPPSKIWLVIPILIALLTACASPPAAAGVNKPDLVTPAATVLPSPTALPTAEPSATLLPTSVQPTSTISARIRIWQDDGCSNAHLQDSVLLAIWHNAVRANLLTPVDPETGQPLCNVEPIRAGTQYFTALSPQGETLAITISVREDGGDARLYLLDLTSWQLDETPVEFDRWIGLMAYSPDGKQLAVVSSGPTYGTQSMQYGAQLSLVDLASQTVTAETQLDFNPRLLEYLSDGSALILYGGSQNSESLAEGDPEAVMLDPTDLAEIWKTALPGILEGGYQAKTIEGPEGMLNWFPGVAFAPQSQALYIVHADSDRLTKIDLAQKTVDTVEIRRPTSWLERLLALTAGVAHAKTLNGTSKTAVLSPDERRLYIVGVTGDTWLDTRGDWHFEESWQDLQAVDPDTGFEVARLEVDSADLLLSQDGSLIFLRGWDVSSPFTEVIEASSLEPVTRLRGSYLVTTNRLNGEPLLLSNASNEHQTRLSLIDNTTLAETVQWWIWGYANWLALK